MSNKSSQGLLLSSNRCCYLRLGTDIGFPSELKNKMLTKHSFAVYADYNYYVPGVLWYIALQRPTASLLSLPFTSGRLIVSLLLTLSPHQESSIIAMPEVVSFRNPVRSCRDPCQVKDISLS